VEGGRERIKRAPWAAWGAAGEGRRRLLPVDPAYGGLQQVVLVAGRVLGVVLVDLVLAEPDCAQGAGGAAQDGEGVAVLAG
jgi:hypothetical protein